MFKSPYIIRIQWSTGLNEIMLWSALSQFVYGAKHSFEPVRITTLILEPTESGISKSSLISQELRALNPYCATTTCWTSLCMGEVSTECQLAFWTVYWKVFWKSGDRIYGKLPSNVRRFYQRHICGMDLSSCEATGALCDIGFTATMCEKLEIPL